MPLDALWAAPLPGSLAAEYSDSDDGGSGDEAAEAARDRMERRAEAVTAVRQNLRCGRGLCALEPWQVRAPRLVRQKAVAFQEAVHLPCGGCGAPVEAVIRY